MAKSKGKTASQIVSESRQELVDQLIQKMKDGVSPVREMWDSVSTYGLPNNPISGARYQGVNLLRLLIASAVGKYEDSRWMTLKQANKQGYRIKKGAKSVLLEKWVWSKIVEEENENGELEKKIVKLRNPYVNFFRVFNAEQIDGIGPIPKVIPMEKNEMLKLAEEVIASSQCEIVESMQNRAYYSPKEDKITLPPRDYFKSQEAFLAVTLHEMSHSTGHPDRLNRPLVNKFGTPEYAKEELNAELTSLFLENDFNISIEPESEIIKDHANYVKSWLAVLKKEPDALFDSCRTAEKISDYLLENYRELEHSRNVENVRSETVAEETGISRQGESFARQEMLQEMRAEMGFGNMIL